MREGKVLMDDAYKTNLTRAQEIVDGIDEFRPPGGVSKPTVAEIAVRFLTWSETAKTDDIFFVADEVDTTLGNKGDEIKELESKEEFVSFIWNEVLQKTFEHNTQIVDFHVLNGRIMQVLTTREQNSSFPIYSVECLGEVFQYASYLIKVIKELVKYRSDKSTNVSTQWILEQLEDEDNK